MKTKEEHTKETKEKQRKAMLERKERLGYINSPETRKKMSKAKKGKKLSEEHKKKLSKAHKGKERAPFSEKTRKKMSKSQKELVKKGIHHLWQGGIWNNPYPVDWTKTLKRSIRERDRYICQICGKEPAIQVHHIDYDKKNNNSDNLITLCRRCHSKTNYNRNYWKQFFQELCQNLSEK